MAQSRDFREDSPQLDWMDMKRGRTLHRKDSNSSLLSELLSEAGRRHIEESRSRSETPNPSFSRDQSPFRPESQYYTPSPGQDPSSPEEGVDPQAFNCWGEQLQERWPEHAQEIYLLYQDDPEGPGVPSAQNLEVGFATELGPIKCTRNHPSKEETCGKLFDRLIDLARHNETAHEHTWICPLCATKTTYEKHLFLVSHLERFHRHANPYIVMWYGDPSVDFSDNVWLNLDLWFHLPDKSSKSDEIQATKPRTNPVAQSEHSVEGTQNFTESSSPLIDPTTMTEKLQSQSNFGPSELAGLFPPSRTPSRIPSDIPSILSCDIPTIKELSTSDKVTACKVCNKFRGRPSEVRKHMRRHERPYGCTFPLCSRAFGSKYDWKRHEQNQHYAPWVYTCIHCLSSKDPDNPPELFADGESYTCHILGHRFDEDELLVQGLKLCLYGESGISRAFYCGFCVDIVFVAFEEGKAFDERCNHITNHFINHGARIKNWVTRRLLGKAASLLPSSPSSE